MSERKLYELTDGEVDLLKTALHFSKAPQNLKDDLTATLTPLGPDAATVDDLGNEAVERMARAILRNTYGGNVDLLSYNAWEIARSDARAALDAFTQGVTHGAE